MKLTIALGLLVVLFVASSEGLQCWTCKNVDSATCLSGGSLQTCIGQQDTCQTTERKRGNSYLYWKECKQGQACRTNENNNPRDCHRNQIESTCRCCCSETGCGRTDNNCGPSTPVTGPNPTTTTPFVPPEPTTTTPEPITTTTTKKPIPTPDDEICYCEEIDPWVWSESGGEVICDPSLDNGYWAGGAVCRYICPNDFSIIGTPFRVCRAARDDPKVISERIYVWKEEAPDCSRDPGTFCQEAPFIREDTPGGKVDYLCDEPELPGGGYSLNARCEYFCVNGNLRLNGVNVTTCQTVLIDDIVTNEFTPSNPCCDTECETDEIADLVFVVDWSSSITRPEWTAMREFVADSIEILQFNKNLRFGVVVFGNGIRTNLNEPFAPFSLELLSRVNSLEFNEDRIEGTHTIAALNFVRNQVFGPEDLFNHRQSAEKLVVFLTDGVSTDSGAYFKQPDTTALFDSTVASFHTSTDTVFAVGISQNSERIENNLARAREEVKAIAQAEKNVFNIGGFFDLNDNLFNITQIACDRACASFVQQSSEIFKG